MHKDENVIWHLKHTTHSFSYKKAKLLADVMTRPKNFSESIVLYFTLSNMRWKFLHDLQGKTTKNEIVP